MNKIYILKNNKVLIGPFTIEKLIARTVKATDLIWYDGLSDWMEASKIPHVHAAISELVLVQQPKAGKSFKQMIGKIFSGTRS